MHRSYSMKLNQFKCGVLLCMGILIVPPLLAGTEAKTIQNSEPWLFRSLVLGDVNKMLDGIPAGEGCLKTGEVEADFGPTTIFERGDSVTGQLYTYDFSFDKQGNLLHRASGNKTAWRGVLLPTGNKHISQVILQNRNCSEKKIHFRFYNDLQGYYFNSQTLRMCNFASSTLLREKKIDSSDFVDCYDWPKYLRDKKRKFINISQTGSEEATLYLAKYAGYFRFNDPTKPVIGIDQTMLTDVWYCFANCPSGKPGKFDPN